jgi:hypothetical protein
VIAFGFQEKKQFVVLCKRCRRDVPIGVKEFPFQSLVVMCPLCDERHKYLPSEVFLGRPNDLVGKQPPMSAR